MLQPKKYKDNKTLISNNIQNAIKRSAELNMLETKRANLDRAELNKTGMIRNPKSISYQSKLKEITDLHEEKRNDYEFKVDQEKGKSIENKKKILKTANLLANAAEFGNFVPHPYAQTIGKIGASASTAINSYQLYEDIKNKDLNSALIDGGSLVLSNFLGSNAFKRNSKNSQTGGLLNKILNTNGSRTPYINIRNRVRKQTKLGIETNRLMAASTLTNYAYNANDLLKDFK